AIKGMLIAKIRNRALGIVLALLLAGGGLGAWRGFAPRTDSANSSPVPTLGDEGPAVGGGDGEGVQAKAPAPIAGPTALVRGKVLDAAGHAVPFAMVTALVRRPFQPGEHGLRDEVVARGQADEQGEFRLRVPADFPTWFPERQVVLVAKAPGPAPLTTLVRLADPGATHGDLQLTTAGRVAPGRWLAPDAAA